LAVDVLLDDRQRCACAGDGEVGRRLQVSADAGADRIGALRMATRRTARRQPEQPPTLAAVVDHPTPPAPAPIHNTQGHARPIRAGHAGGVTPQVGRADRLRRPARARVGAASWSAALAAYWKRQTDCGQPECLCLRAAEGSRTGFSEQTLLGRCYHCLGFCRRCLGLGPLRLLPRLLTHLSRLPPRGPRALLRVPSPVRRSTPPRRR
jgi:hypothetical protein